MTATVADTRVTGPGTAGSRPVAVARILRLELIKQTSAWRVRLLLLLSWVGPGLAVFAVCQQGTLPSDTLFGRQMHATGWAGSLVVLGGAGTWVLPLLTSMVAGDVFASEDRLGTWRHLIVAVRSPRRIFAAKAIASLTVILVGVVGLAVSSIVGGLLAEGNQPLIGLDGHLLSGGDAGGKTLLAWLCVLAPTLALAACSDRSRLAGPRWACCCPCSPPSECRWRRCCRCRSRCAWRCPATPSSPGTDCSPIPSKPGRC
jgi:ABC-2 type transport system permease protein